MEYLLMAIVLACCAYALVTWRAHAIGVNLF